MFLIDLWPCWSRTIITLFNLMTRMKQQNLPICSPICIDWPSCPVTVMSSLRGFRYWGELSKVYMISRAAPASTEPSRAGHEGSSSSYAKGACSSSQEQHAFAPQGWQSQGPGGGHPLHARWSRQDLQRPQRDRPWKFWCCILCKYMLHMIILWNGSFGLKKRVVCFL